MILPLAALKQGTISIDDIDEATIAPWQDHRKKDPAALNLSADPQTKTSFGGLCPSVTCAVRWRSAGVPWQSGYAPPTGRRVW